MRNKFGNLRTFLDEWPDVFYTRNGFLNLKSDEEKSQDDLYLDPPHFEEGVGADADGARDILPPRYRSGYRGLGGGGGLMVALTPVTRWVRRTVMMWMYIGVKYLHGVLRAKETYTGTYKETCKQTQTWDLSPATPRTVMWTCRMRIGVKTPAGPWSNAPIYN